MLTNESRCRNCGGKLVPVNAIKSVCENCESVFVKAPPTPPSKPQNNSGEIEKIEDYLYMVINNKIKENPILTRQYKERLLKLKPESVYLMFLPGHGPVAPFENIYAQIKNQKEFCYCLNNWLTTFYIIVISAKKIFNEKVSVVSISKQQKATILKKMEESLYTTNEILTVLEGVKNSEYISTEEIQELLVLGFNKMKRDTADERNFCGDYLLPVYQAIYNLLTSETLNKHPEISMKDLENQNSDNSQLDEEIEEYESMNTTDTRNEEVKNTRYEYYKKKFSSFEKKTNLNGLNVITQLKSDNSNFTNQSTSAMTTINQYNNYNQQETPANKKKSILFWTLWGITTAVSILGIALSFLDIWGPFDEIPSGVGGTLFVTAIVTLIVYFIKRKKQQISETEQQSSNISGNTTKQQNNPSQSNIPTQNYNFNNAQQPHQIRKASKGFWISWSIMTGFALVYSFSLISSAYGIYNFIPIILSSLLLFATSILSIVYFSKRGRSSKEFWIWWAISTGLAVLFIILGYQNIWNYMNEVPCSIGGVMFLVSIIMLIIYLVKNKKQM